MSDGIKRINEHLIKEGRTLVMTKFISDTSKIAEGSIYINPTNGQLKYVHLKDDGTKFWNSFNMSDLFEPNTFDSAIMADNSVHAAKLTDASIATDKLADSSVTTDKIANKSITDSKFEINSIDGDKIKDYSIVTSKIHVNSIVNSLIADKAVTTGKIADKAITLIKMADNSIATSHINDKAIITSKIADKAITSALIGDRVITSSNIALKEVKADNIDSAAVTYDKIQDGAVQAKKIPNFGIKDDHIDSMDGYKIFDNTITAAKIKNNAITNPLIADKAVSLGKLDSDTQSLINNSIKIQPIVVIDNVEHYSTAHINGSVVIKNNNGTKANLEVAGDINASGDITGARVFNPYFADAAEAYFPVGNLKAGDPVALCAEGGLKVEALTEENCSRFIGFISNNYATLFGGHKKDVESGKMVAVCLIGRIKIKLPQYLSGSVGDYVNVYKYDGLFVTSKTRTSHSVGRLLERKMPYNDYVLCQLWP